MFINFVVNSGLYYGDSTVIRFDKTEFKEGIANVTADSGLFRFSGLKYGDVDISGAIQAIDASLILQYKLEEISLDSVQKTVADVSGNGTITGYDASIILRYTVELDTFGLVGQVLQKKALPSNQDMQMDLIAGVSDEYMTITVEMSNIKSVFAVEGHLVYDNACLEYAGFTLGAFECPAMAEVLDDNGLVKFVVVSAEEINGDGKFINLKFKLKGDLSDGDAVSIGYLMLNEEQIQKSVTQSIALPKVFGLEQNYPNPFNPETVIRYTVPQGCFVSLKVFNIMGQEVATLVNENHDAGYFTARWNGLNDYGQKVASGIYIYRLKAGEFVKHRKMVFLK